MEGSGALPRKERRRDRRIPLGGKLRVVRSTPRAPVEGNILDVSAGGARVALPVRPSFREGQPLRFELRVGGPPVTRLTGRGTILRIRAVGEAEQEIAVRFEAPLAVLEAFPAVSAF
jgi:hypothetical protein